MSYTEATIFRYSGLSSDTKPTAAGGVLVPNGSVWREVDTRKTYYYHLSNDAWYQFLPYIDASTLAQLYIEYAHHEVHEGDHFELGGYVDVGLNGTLEIIVTTPNTTKWAHMLWVVDVTQSTILDIYRSPTTIAGGTTLTPQNNNDNSSNTSGLTILQDPASIGGDGTLLPISHKIGANRTSGSSVRDRELILKQNTAYLFRATSGAASNTINFTMSWYEHTAIS